MAWTSPMTWVDGEILTSAQLNLHLRDNLLETLTGKATVASQFFVSDVNNNIVERNPGADYLDNGLENVSSNEWGDIETVGPRITRATGPRVLVMWGCQFVLGDGSTTSIDGSVGLASIGISPFAEPGSEDESDTSDGGTDAFEPSDDYALMRQNTVTTNTSGDVFQGSQYIMIHDLFEPEEGQTSAQFTFTVKYRKSGANTIRVRRRSIFVWPLS